VEYCIFINWGYVKDIIVGLISAGIPSFVAWKVFKGWRIQKKSEKLSFFCEESYKNLNDLNKEINELYKNFSKIPVTDITKDIEDKLFLNKFNSIKKKFKDFEIELEILYDKTGNSLINNQINSIQSLIDKNFEVYSCIINKEESRLDHFNSLNTKIFEFDEKFDNFKKNINKILTDYIFYEE